MCLFGALVAVFAGVCLTQVHSWVIDDSGCRTPDGGVGDCMEISSCKILLPINDNPELLNSYVCGVSKNTYGYQQYKICCPRKEASLPPRVLENIDTDLPNHKNIDLLPLKKCGLLYSDNRITNGEKAALFEFPWMALIKYQTKNGLVPKCGGTLINNRYVLTAAHCLVTGKSIQPTEVVLGEHDLSKEIDCEIDDDNDEICSPPTQTFGIEKIITHEEFSFSSYSYDIALIRLNGTVDLKPRNVKPICLPVRYSNRKITALNGIVTGWGITETDHSSEILMRVEIPFVEKEECKKAYTQYEQNTINDIQICAGGKDQKSSCDGDSGGPLQVVGLINKKARVIQSGIVSFGIVPCTKDTPVVFTKVSDFITWILDNITS